MIRQEKAKDFVIKFINEESCYESAKQCALIAVEEIINELEQLHKPEYTVFIMEDSTTMNGYEKLEYYQSVKTEIEKL